MARVVGRLIGVGVLALVVAGGCAVNAGARRGLAEGAFAFPEDQDENLWLEDVTGDASLDWVRARNEVSVAGLMSAPESESLRADLQAIMDSDDRIPFVEKYGDWYYNFWRDERNPRGLWRRTTLGEYRKAQPEWEVVLDLDALNAAEGENWVFKGAEILRPENRLALLSLSRGGADAVVVREFDIEKKAFVEGGFQIPEAKGGLGWIDEDTVYVMTDFGPGSMTTSGYPRIAKIWKRGTPLEDAGIVFGVAETDMGVSAWFDDTPGFERHFVARQIAFYRSQTYVEDGEGELRMIKVPIDAEPSVFREWLLVRLRSDWAVGGRVFPAGSLIATKFDDFMKGGLNFEVLFEPTESSSLEAFTWTRHHLVLNVIQDVRSSLVVLTPSDAAWKREAFPGVPANAQVSVTAIDAWESDAVFLTVMDFLTPMTLYYGTIGQQPEILKTTPAQFDASGLEVRQHFAKSADGTRIPYFQVSRAGMPLDGSNVTLINGYGGFEISLTPRYNPLVGRAWLQEGGVYVQANIRGGGEYGPRWHQAALRENRPRAFEDFAAIAQDLIDRGVTSVPRLGAIGGSNGGLLMGNMITRYPDLFGAIVCQVPLLDMKRYSHLLAGASWMAEYGDPDKPEDWAFMRGFSAYHNLRRDVRHPPVLFVTSTRDDRVHPGHARKMMARMMSLGADVTYYENIEGGHGGAADNRQRSFITAMSYIFLWQKLGTGTGPGTGPGTGSGAGTDLRGPTNGRDVQTRGFQPRSYRGRFSLRSNLAHYEFKIGARQNDV